MVSLTAEFNPRPGQCRNLSFLYSLGCLWYRRCLSLSLKHTENGCGSRACRVGSTRVDCLEFLCFILGLFIYLVSFPKKHFLSFYYWSSTSLSQSVIFHFSIDAHTHFVARNTRLRVNLRVIDASWNYLRKESSSFVKTKG